MVVILGQLVDAGVVSPATYTLPALSSAMATARSVLPSTDPWYRATQSSFTCAEAKAGNNKTNSSHPSLIVLALTAHSLPRFLLFLLAPPLTHHHFPPLKFELLLRVNLNMIQPPYSAGFVEWTVGSPLETTRRSVRCDLGGWASEA